MYRHDVCIDVCIDVSRLELDSTRYWLEFDVPPLGGAQYNLCFGLYLFRFVFVFETGFFPPVRSLWHAACLARMPTSSWGWSVTRGKRRYDAPTGTCDFSTFRLFEDDENCDLFSTFFPPRGVLRVDGGPEGICAPHLSSPTWSLARSSSLNPVLATLRLAHTHNPYSHFPAGSSPSSSILTKTPTTQMLPPSLQSCKRRMRSSVTQRPVQHSTRG